MKKQLLQIVTAVTFLSFPNTISAQAPNLGTAADFVLFSKSTALYPIPAFSIGTGHVGTNNGLSTDGSKR